MLLIGIVNAQDSPCPPLVYQQIQIGEYIDVCVNIKIGDQYEPCLDCTCNIRFEDSYGKTINTPTNSLFNENNGYYSYRLTTPYFIASQTVDPSDETGNYRYWVNCTNDNFEGYDYSTFDIIKDDGSSTAIIPTLNIEDYIPSEDTRDVDEGIFEKIRIELYDLLDINPSKNEIGAVDGMLEGVFGAMGTLGEFLNSIKEFIKRPADFITKDIYLYLSDLTFEILGAFFLTVFLVECIIAVLSLRENKNDVFNMMVDFFKYNGQAFLFLFSIITVVTSLLSTVINILISTVRMIWEMVPFKKFIGI